MTRIINKYAIRKKGTDLFLKCFNDDYCCYKIELVKDINNATLYEKFFDSEVLNKALSHAISDEFIRKHFEEIPVKITYSYDKQNPNVVEINDDIPSIAYNKMIDDLFNEFLKEVNYDDRDKFTLMKQALIKGYQTGFNKGLQTTMNDKDIDQSLVISTLSKLKQSKQQTKCESIDISKEFDEQEALKEFLNTTSIVKDKE